MDSTSTDTTSTSSLQTKKKKTVVHLSPATWQDAPAIANVYLRSFASNPHLYILSPEYTGLSIDEILRVGLRSETRSFRQRLVSTDVGIKASIFSENEYGETSETVVGYAGWTSPDDTRKRTLWEWFLSTIFYPVCNFLRLSKPPALPPNILELMSEQRDKTFGKGARWEGRKYWYLHYLCVLPDWQGVGVGTLLLQWGFDRAKESDSVVYLEASPMGLPFYKSKGVEVVANAPRKLCGIYTEAPGMLWEPRLK